MMIRRQFPFGVVAAVLSVLVAPACGGGSSSPATPPVPQERLVTQGTMSLRDGVDAIRHLGYLDTATAPFTTSGEGLLRVTVDYTFVDSELLPVVYVGACSLDLARLVKCPVVTTQELTRGKPYVITVNGLPAGQYTLSVMNGGLHKESVAYRVTLTN